MKSTISLKMEHSQRAARQTRRAIIAFVIIEAVVIFGSISITLLRKQSHAQTAPSTTLLPR